MDYNNLLTVYNNPYYNLYYYNPRINIYPSCPVKRGTTVAPTTHFTETVHLYNRCKGPIGIRIHTHRRKDGILSYSQVS